MTVTFLDPALTTLVVIELRPKGAAVTAIAPNGEVWSVPAEGPIVTKPANFDGGHETAQVNGSVLAYHPEGDGRYVVVPFVRVDAL